jgi:hypothetical protein
MKNISEFIGEAVELTNQVADLKTPPDWIEIPFGNHDHKEGLQVLDRESAEAIVANFHEEQSSKGKRFAGLPVYIGHPDHPAFADTYKDKAAKAWIKEIALAPDALRLRTRWNASGRDLVANEEYKYFSPTWGALPIAGRSAAYRPVRLKSVGLTNEPNIGVMPLTNEKEIPMQTLPPWLVKLLGLADDATEEHVKEKLAEVMKKLDESENANAVQLANEQTARTAAETAREAAEVAFANERKARCELLVANAIAQGRLTLADKERTLTELANAAPESFTARAAELASRPPVLKTGAAHTAHLGQRKESSDAATAVLTLVNARMDQNREDYDTAFARIRKEKPELFANMKQPANA